MIDSFTLTLFFFFENYVRVLCTCRSNSPSTIILWYIITPLPTRVTGEKKRLKKKSERSINHDKKKQQSKPTMYCTTTTVVVVIFFFSYQSVTRISNNLSIHNTVHNKQAINPQYNTIQYNTIQYNTIQI